MKTNATTLLTILGQDKVGFFTLVKLGWNSTYYFTDLGRDVSFNGQLWLSNNPIVSVAPPAYSTTVDREKFDMSLSGLNSDMADEVDTGVVHMPVDIFMMFTVDGVPQLSANQAMHYYSGKVLSSKTILSDDEKLINVELSAPLNNLDAKSTLYTTKDGISAFDSTDTCFDNVSKGSEEISLKWGKV
jgi:hypothetical protein